MGRGCKHPTYSQEFGRQRTGAVSRKTHEVRFGAELIRVNDEIDGESGDENTPPGRVRGW